MGRGLCVVGVPVVLILAALGCAAEPDDLSGVWEATLTLTRDDREQTVPLALRLRQTGHALSGELQARRAGRGPGRFPGTFPGRRFEITEGLASAEQVFFHARAFLPIGTATLVFHGRVETDRLAGEVTVDVRTTEGEAELAGRLVARRRAPEEP